MGKEVPLGAGRHAPGSHGETALPVHLDDDEINHRTNHILKHKVGPLLAVLPHLRGGDHNPYPVGNHHGAVHGLPLHFSGLPVPGADGQRINADDLARERAAAPVGGIDGVPFLAFLRCQPPVQSVEVQIVECLPVIFLRGGCSRRFGLRLRGQLLPRRRYIPQ